MKQNKYVFLILLAGLAGFLLVKSAKPKLYAAQTKHDFGVIDQGGELQHQFSIQNSGWKPLELSSISTSCGCIKLARVNSNRLNPGQKTALHVTWDVPNYTTRVNETINVQTNDPGQPVHTFAISATVQAHAALEPPVVNFGILEKSDLPNSETLTFKGDKPLLNDATLQVTTRNPFLTSEVKQESNTVWKIELKVGRDAPLGPLDGEIEVKPSGGNALNVALLGEVIGDAVAEPGEVFIDKSQSLNGKIAVKVAPSETAPAGTTIKAVRNVSLDPEISRYLTVEADGNQLEVAYKFPDTQTKETLRGYLAFDAELGNGAQVPMRMPVVARLNG